MGIFESVFARILRAEEHHMGYPNNFTIYDTDDSKSLIKSVVKEMGLDETQYKANLIYNRISGAKNKLISWQEYLANPMLMGDDAANMKPEIGNIYKNYALRCFKSGAMDFDDLLFNTDKLFKEHLEVLNKYQHKISYVLVDEFQDTNLCQYFIIRKLAAASIFEEKMQNQYSFSDFVVLYRTNSQSRAIEEALRRLNIKYRVVGGLSFYQRKEIKDLLAYLRFSLNQQDEASFRRIINLPKRGIGDSTIDKIVVAANDHAVSILEVLENAPSFLGGRASGPIDDFVTKIKRFGE